MKLVVSSCGASDFAARFPPLVPLTVCCVCNLSSKANPDLRKEGGRGAGNDSRRRGRKKRSSEREERALMDGVRQFRVGHWKEILVANYDSLSSRTQVDLKVQSVCGDVRNVCVHKRAIK